MCSFFVDFNPRSQAKYDEIRHLNWKLLLSEGRTKVTSESSFVCEELAIFTVLILKRRKFRKLFLMILWILHEQVGLL